MQDFSKLVKNANDDLTKDGEPFRYCSNSQNRLDNKQKVWIFCDAAKNIDFDIKPESWVDKFFKWLKISHEMQLGDRQLDNLIYFATDDSEVFNTIKNSPEIQIEILEMIKICKDSKIKLDLLSLHKGQIGIILRQKKYSSVRETAEKLVPLLRKISNQFDEKMRNTMRTEDQVLPKIQRILKPLTYNFLFLIFAALPLILFDSGKQLISILPLIKTSILIGIIATVLVMIFAVIYLAGSSRVHLVLKAIVLAGIVNFSFDSFIILDNVNIYFDKSTARFVDTKISSKYNGGRSGHEYLTFEGSSSGVPISHATYEKINVGEKLCVKEMPGFLGYKWIDGFYLGSCDDAKLHGDAF